MMDGGWDRREVLRFVTYKTIQNRRWGKWSSVGGEERRDKRHVI